jgi:hypothetical protein
VDVTAVGKPGDRLSRHLDDGAVLGRDDRADSTKPSIRFRDSSSALLVEEATDGDTT